ncbi:MAG: LpqB family beta-propeller domain-containing protein, partial [Nitrospinales bacterium]
MAWTLLCCFAQPAGAVAAFNEPAQVTTHPGEDFAPSFFTDGRAMVYVSDKSGNLDLWWKRLGSGVRPPDRQLTFHAAADTSPSLSPDGKWVAFISNRSDPKGDLYLLPLDAANLKNGQEAEAVRLTDASSSESDPVWSADQRAVFFSSLDAGSNLKNVYRLDIKTRSKTLVTSLDGVNLAMSPDGGRLAFVSKKEDPSGSVWVKDLRKNYTVQATQGPDIDVSPKWSRDGRHIYFVRYRDDTNQDGQLTIDDRPNIWKVTLRRFGIGEVQQLTDSSTYDLFPNEAGGKLFFTSTRKNNIDIWELPIDGALSLPNDYRNAVKIVEDLCSGPDSVSYRCLLAFTNLAEKFKKESGISRIRYRLGKIYLEMGHSGLAEKVFRSILASPPDDPAYRDLAEIELLLLQAEKSKKQGEAVYRATLRKILGAVRQDAVFDPGLLTRPRIDRSANASTLENLAKQEQPLVAARAHLEMGHLYFELDELSRALEFYQKVIQDYPGQRTLAAEAAFSKSKIYATVGDRGKLVKAFVQVAGEYRDVERWARKAIREIFSLFEKQPT